MARNILFTNFKDFKIHLQKSPMYRENFREVLTFLTLSRKKDLVFVRPTLHLFSLLATLNRTDHLL